MERKRVMALAQAREIEAEVVRRNRLTNTVDKRSRKPNHPIILAANSYSG
jgi:hypothetical protein